LEAFIIQSGRSNWNYKSRQKRRKTMSKSKIIALIAVMSFAFAMTAIDNAVADEARNERIIERNLEIWHNVDMTVADEIVAANYVRHFPDGSEIRGREAYKKHVKGFMSAFPDMFFNMDVMIAKGDYVVVHYTGTATHTGETEVYGPPTGKKITIRAIVIHRLAGGKMIECYEVADGLGLMLQLGYKLVPPGEE
jgi:predicted ester cyclase